VRCRLGKTELAPHLAQRAQPAGLDVPLALPEGIEQVFVLEDLERLLEDLLLLGGDEESGGPAVPGDQDMLMPLGQLVEELAELGSSLREGNGLAHEPQLYRKLYITANVQVRLDSCRRAGIAGDHRRSAITFLSVRRVQRGRHVIEDHGGSRRFERADVHESLDAATTEEAHHEVLGVGLPPVVVGEAMCSNRRTKSGWFASSGWTALIAT